MKTPLLISIGVIFVVLVAAVVTLILTGHDPTAFIAFLPSLAAVGTVLFMVSSTNQKVDTVQKQTNGTLAAKDAQIAALTASLAKVTDPDTATAVATNAVVPETLKVSNPTSP